MKTKNNLLSSASHFALVAGVTVSLSAFAVSASAQPVTAEPESDAAAIVTAPLDVQGQAEGYATERVNQALGEVARFNAVLAEYRNAPEVTRSRLYIETLRDVLPRIGSVVVMKEGQVLPLLNMDQGQLRRMLQQEEQR